MAVDKLVDSAQLDADLSLVADAIRGKGGTSSELDFPSGFVSAVSNISTEMKDVNFIDYDGTLLYSYTAEEFANLEEMPEIPAHEDLSATEWTYTLSNAKEYVSEYNYLDLSPSYTYTGKAKTSVLYIHFDEDTPADLLTFGVRLKVTYGGSATIDWGDGSNNETETSISFVTHDHTYAEPGDYAIEVTVSSGYVYLGGGSSGYAVYGTASTDRIHVASRLRKVILGEGAKETGSYCFSNCYNLETIIISANASVMMIEESSFRNCHKVKHITFPSCVGALNSNCFDQCYGLRTLSFAYGGVTAVSNTIWGSTANVSNIKSLTLPAVARIIGTNLISYNKQLTRCTLPKAMLSLGSGTFSGCSNLKKVNFPSGITAIPNSFCSSCVNLEEINIPSGVTSLGASCFSGVWKLKEINIPSGVTSIGDSAFSNCHSLKTLTIPDSVTTFGTSAFTSCSGMEEYHFLATTPPTIPSGIFNYNNNYFKIYVPYSADHSVVAAYKAASVWSSYSDHIFEEPSGS